MIRWPFLLLCATRGDEALGQFAKVTKGKVDADWMSDLHRWWLEHRYYPEQAAMAGEDGTVKIQIQSSITSPTCH